MKISGADEPASIQNMDVLVKPTWMCFRRLAGLSAHKVALSHSCDRDIPFIQNIPAAGNGLD